MSARLAAAFTTCQIALGVILSPQILSIRLTRRKIAPPLIPAAVIHSSTARFAHTGTGTVHVLSFTNQVSNHAVLLTDLEVFRSESNHFGSSQSASDEQRQNRPITFASEAT